MDLRRPSRRTRSSTTTTSFKYWLTATTLTYLAGRALAAQVQPGRHDSAALARDPDLNDILETAIWPAVDATPSTGYEQILERARRQVRLELRAEEEKRERQRLTAAAAVRDSDRRDDREGRLLSPKTDDTAQGGVRVVRETFYIPLDGDPSRTDSGVRDGSPTPQNATLPATEPPADFLRTVSKLRVFRPLFTYAIHHPLRFLLAYILTPVLSLAWTVVASLFSLVLLVLSPIRFLFSTFVLAPAAFAQSVISALAPLFYTLLGALAIGAGLGAIGGLVAAKSTRAAIEGTVRTGSNVLQWLGVLPGDTSTAQQASRRYSTPTAAVGVAAEESEATITPSETIPETSSSAGARTPVSIEVVQVEVPDDASEAARKRANQLEALRHRIKVERVET